MASEPVIYELLPFFVKSGYQVIAGNGLVSDGKINKEKVDNASYYYEFLTNAKGYDNVVSVDALNNGKGNLSFFANLAKPTITFAENGKPAEPKRMNTSDGEYVDGELKYVFTIGNDSAAIIHPRNHIAVLILNHDILSLFFRRR